jgi:hypothetical protein
MNRNSYRNWVAPALLTAALSLALAGCGGDQAATPAATPPPATATTPTTAATAATATMVPPATASAAEVEQVSPLPNPDSPLVQPASPLAPPESSSTGASAQATVQPAVQGPHIEIAVPSDLAVITQLAEDTKAPAPQEGMASLSGLLYTPVINRIIPGTQYYLTPAIEDNGQFYIPTMFVGPQTDKGDVSGISNEKGQLLLDNIPPGNYYLAVWTIYNWPLAFGSQQDALPLLITLEAGEQRDLGLLYVEWP